jgi:aspartate/methionine/tyrosine aminotransferase
MQSLLVKTYNDPRTNGEKEHYRRILEHRFLAVQKFVNAHKEFKFLQALPFNSGYFMSFACNGVDAETLRKELLTKHGIGTVILSGKYIRIAFSAITEEQVAPVLQKIYDVAKELGEK